VGAPPARPFSVTFPPFPRDPVVASLSRWRCHVVVVVGDVGVTLCVTCHLCQQTAHNHGYGRFAGKDTSCKDRHEPLE
jgi:hypothetical protein